MPTPFVVIAAVTTVLAAWWISRLGERGPGRPQHPVHPPLTATPENIRALTFRGEKLQAIKLLRMYSDLGLKESKDIIEALARGEAIALPAAKAPLVTPESPALSEQINEEIKRLVMAGQTMEAIKLYREMSGAGLKESKEAVDLIRTRSQQ
jgi:pentatricopeptide repeat protein